MADGKSGCWTGGLRRGSGAGCQKNGAGHLCPPKNSFRGKGQIQVGSPHTAGIFNAFFRFSLLSISHFGEKKRMKTFAIACGDVQHLFSNRKKKKNRCKTLWGDHDFFTISDGTKNHIWHPGGLAEAKGVWPREVREKFALPGGTQ